MKSVERQTEGVKGNKTVEGGRTGMQTQRTTHTLTLTKKLQFILRVCFVNLGVPGGWGYPSLKMWCNPTKTNRTKTQNVLGPVSGAGLTNSECLSLTLFSLRPADQSQLSHL